MTDWSAGFLDNNEQLFPQSMGELLATFVRKRWPQNTAKRVEAAWDLDTTTARNLTRGHASERTITKALNAEGWPLVMALGEAVTGRPYDQFLQDIVDEQHRAAERAAARRDQLRSLEARAARVVGLHGGPDVD